MAFLNTTLVPSSSDLFMVVPRLGSSIAGLFGFPDVTWFGNMTGNDTSQIFATTAGLFNWGAGNAQGVGAGAGASPSLSASLVEGMWLTVTRIGNMVSLSTGGELGASG